MGMRWIRIWIEETLQGTTFYELDGYERGVWFSLLVLSAVGRHPGIIELRDGVAWEIDLLGKYLGFDDIEKFKKALEKLVKVEKIKFLPDGRIQIVNFDVYQTRYSKYYKGKKAEKMAYKKAENVAYMNTENEAYKNTEKNAENVAYICQVEKEIEEEIEKEEENTYIKNKSNILSEKTPQEDFFLTLSKRTFSSVSDFSEIREYLKTTSLINRNGKIDEELLDKIIEGLQAFPLSRRSGRMKGSHIAKFLQAIQKFHPDAVFDGIAIYLEKHCENKSLTEKYCLGIIRNEQRRIEFELKKKEGKK